jgi:uncharacterized protein YejL (UPF0352 family)
MSSFAFINPKNQLWKSAKIAKVHQRILERLTDLPDVIRKEKHNMELLLMICNMVENSINNTDKKDKLKIDKKSLAIQVLTSLFGEIRPEDIETISKNIEYLHDNNQIVKFSVWTILTANLLDWTKKKLK